MELLNSLSLSKGKHVLEGLGYGGGPGSSKIPELVRDVLGEGVGVGQVSIFAHRGEASTRGKRKLR